MGVKFLGFWLVQTPARIAPTCAVTRQTGVVAGRIASDSFTISLAVGLSSFIFKKDVSHRRNIFILDIPTARFQRAKNEELHHYQAGNVPSWPSQIRGQGSRFPRQWSQGWTPQSEEMNVLLYSRVSTELQLLEPQLIELRACISRNGWNTAGEFSDIMTGKRNSRPGIDALLERCKRRDIGAVVCVKLDRLGRSLLNVVTLINTLEKLGVAIICTSQSIDTRACNPTGKVTYQILAAVAEFERNLISERTKAGLVAARARGSIIGRRKSLVIENSAETIAQWRANGGTLEELADKLGVSKTSAWRISQAS